MESRIALAISYVNLDRHTRKKVSVAHSGLVMTALNSYGFADMQK